MILILADKKLINSSTRGVGSETSILLQLKRHEKDCGSPEVQLYQLSSRIAKLSTHLQEHKHDQATKRGLTKIIGKRLGLLRYLERNNRQKYIEVCTSLGIKRLRNSSK